MSRVLIVEDEEHLAFGLKLNLEAEGFEVEIEEDGQAALDRLTAVAPGFDVVLLDVMLPGLDGFEVVRRLREAGRFVPVLLLTARACLPGLKLARTTIWRSRLTSRSCWRAYTGYFVVKGGSMPMIGRSMRMAWTSSSFRASGWIFESRCCTGMAPNSR